MIVTPSRRLFNQIRLSLPRADLFSLACSIRSRHRLFCTPAPVFRSRDMIIWELLPSYRAVSPTLLLTSEGALEVVRKSTALS